MSAERLELARADIARRRKMAEAATVGPWRFWNDGHVGSAHPDARLGGLFMPTVPANDSHGQRVADARYVAANDPAYVLAVLAAADAILDRHALRRFQSGSKTHGGPPEYSVTCVGCRAWSWPCDDVKAVLDVYAPVQR